MNDDRFAHSRRRAAPIGDRAFASLVFVYASLLPFESISVSGIGLARIPGLVLTVVGGIIALIRPGVSFTIPPLIFAPGMLALASYFWSVDPSATVEKSLTYASLGLITALLIMLGTHRSVKAAIGGLSVGATLAAFQVLRGYETQVFQINDEIRSSAAHANANDLAALFAVVGALVLGIALKTQRRTSYLYLAVALVCFGATVLTASRTAVASVLVAVVVGTSWGAKRLGRRLLTLASLGACAFFVLSAVDLRILDRLRGTGDSVAAGDLNARVPLWRAGIEGWLDRPLTGWGSGSFPEIAFRHIGVRDAAHNTGVSVLAELGIFGGAILVVLIFAGMQAAWRASDPGLRLGFLLAELVLVINMALLSWDHRKLPWLILSLVLLERRLNSSGKRGAETVAGDVHTAESGSGLPRRGRTEPSECT
ncbi:O-antigen ligase family protein [Nocardioides marmoribigeumensis]|uniref:O-antigen ligase n=1 Tax=Nocardioides marmoribigeumensis TaxID=433649 RepID=A0ABU2BTN2_9ACTN|nr:O-antigen ligase family protein [Nocardioides marmoribigeumensis]MDR7361988.1 O-antigen ligase [Nocardioides marmoribigeumensis]